MFKGRGGKWRGCGVAVWVIALASALIALGCGSSSDAGSSGGDSSSSEGSTASSTTGPLTKATFVEQANAICKKGAEEIQAGEQPFFKKHGIKDKTSATPKQSEEFISEVVAPSVKTQAEGVAAIGAPEGDEKEVRAIVSGLEGVARGAAEAPTTVVNETPKSLLAEVNSAAKAYGAEECTQP